MTAAAVSSLNEAGAFGATHWSVVLAARNTAGDTEVAALETLCRAYWPPLYAFVRRQGYTPHDAQDLTQAFFARLLQKHYLKSVDPAKGRFRSFLLAALKHFLANEWRNANCQKRGGDRQFVYFDDASAEALYAQAPTDLMTPEKVFERQWATTLLERVLGRLRDEFVRSGKESLFDRLKVFLTGERQKEGRSYPIVAGELGLSEGACKMAVSRLKRRYGELLRDEISRTVSGPAEIEAEIRALFAALSH